MDKATRPTTSLLRLHGTDNVLVATRIIEKGETVDGLTATGKVMRGHKIAAAQEIEQPHARAIGEGGKDAVGGGG